MNDIQSKTASILPRIVLVMSIVATLLSATYVRNITWSDQLSLWQDTALKSPEKARANYELGMAYGALHRNEEAFQYVEKARKLDPVAVAREVKSISEVSQDTAENHSAIEGFSATGQVAGQSSRMDPVHQMMLVVSSLDKGNYESAFAMIQDVLKADPTNTDAYLSLARIHNHFNQTEQENEAYNMAIKRGRAIAPKQFAYLNQGILFGKQGKYREAVANFKESLKIKPSYEAHYALSVTYSHIGLREEAAREYQKALDVRK